MSLLRTSVSTAVLLSALVTSGRAQTAPNIPKAERLPWHPPELVSVLGTHRGHHWAAPAGLAVSRDGKLIASAAGRNVRIWDTATLRERHSVMSLPGTVYNLSFSPDGKFLAGGVNSSIESRSSHVRIWELTAEGLIERHRLTNLANRITRLVYADDGNTLLVQSHRFLQVFDTSGARPVERHTIVTPQRVYFEGTMSRDGTRVAFILDRSKIQIWDVSGTERKLIHDWKSNSIGGRRGQLRFSPNGKMLAAVMPNTIEVWNLESKVPVRIDSIKPRSQPSAVDKRLRVGVSEAIFLDDKRLFIIVGGIGSIWQYDNTFKFKQKLTAGHYFVHALVDRTSKRLVTLGRPSMGYRFAPGADVRLWSLEDAPTELPQSVTAHDAPAILGAYQGPSLRATKDDDVLMASTLKGPVRISIVTDDRRVVASGDARWAQSFDEKYVVTVPFPSGMRRLPGTFAEVYESATGKRIAKIAPLTTSIKQVALNPDGRWLALQDATPSTIKLFDVNSGKLLHQVKLPADKDVQLEFIAKEKLLTSCYHWSDMGEPVVAFTLWRVADEKLQKIGYWESSRHDSHGGLTALSTNRKWLACQRAGKGVNVFELTEKGAELRAEVEYDDRQYFLKSMSSDGKTISLGTYGHLQDNALIVMDVPSGRVLRRWSLPGNITSACFLNDDNHLATVNADGTIFILRLPDRKHLKPRPPQVALPRVKDNVEGRKKYAAMIKQHEADQEKQQQLIKKSRNRPRVVVDVNSKFIKPMKQLAMEYRDSTVERDALMFVLRHGNGRDVAETRDRVMERFAEHAVLATVVHKLVLQSNHRQGADTARELIRRSPHRRVQALAYWHLAYILRNYRPNGYYVPNPNQMTPRQREVQVGLLRRIHKDYGDVPFGGKTLGLKARSELIRQKAPLKQSAKDKR